MSQIDAYAVRQNGKLLANTVFSTPRGAKINWLIAEREIVVRAHWTDDGIEAVWQREKRTRGLEVEVVRVTITEQAVQ